MKKIMYAVLTVVAFLSLSGPVKAQSGLMTPHYSMVHNWSVTVDSNNNWTVSSQVITEGYATLNCTNCGFNTTGSTHYAEANQSWATPTNMSYVNGGMVSGARLCVTCNLYAESDGTATANDLQCLSDLSYCPPAVDYLINEDNTSSVICSVAGLFFSEGEYLDFEIAYTRDVNSGVSQGTVACGSGTCNVWKISSWCTQPTTPPDWNPNAFIASVSVPGQPQSIWYSDAITPCVRIHGTGINGWVCLADAAGSLFQSAATITYPASSHLNSANCSHNP